MDPDIVVEGTIAHWASRTARVALGRSGLRPSGQKREGDGTTPAGTFKFLSAHFRPDRRAAPGTHLPVRAIAPFDGWCDDPADAAYNRAVTLPYPASAERLWRDDHLYDLLVVIDHNSAPVVPGHGSAIFLHLAHTDYRPTDGCVAFAPADLEALLAAIGPGTRLVIRP